MVSQKEYRHPPLAQHSNRREFIPTSPNRTAPAPTLYVSAYHRIAPSQERAFRHVQPAVWYQQHNYWKENTNNVVREYPQTVLADTEPTPVATRSMTETPYVRDIPVNTSPIPDVTWREAQSRRSLHLPPWPLLMRPNKSTIVATYSDTQQLHHHHHHFIHWPHWSHTDHPLSDAGFPRHSWNWRRAHSVGAGAA